MNEIKLGKVLVVSGEPSVVIRTDHHKMGRGGAVLKVKMKGLVSGSVLEKTYQGNDKVEEASTETKKANYMYKDANEAVFMDNNTYEQFTFSLEDLGDKVQYLKDGTDVDVLYFNDKGDKVSETRPTSSQTSSLQPAARSPNHPPNYWP